MEIPHGFSPHHSLQRDVLSLVEVWVDKAWRGSLLHCIFVDHEGSGSSGTGICTGIHIEKAITSFCYLYCHMGANALQSFLECKYANNADVFLSCKDHVQKGHQEKIQDSWGGACCALVMPCPGLDNDLQLCAPC